jgi:hypothetical protein
MSTLFCLEMHIYYLLTLHHCGLHKAYALGRFCRENVLLLLIHIIYAAAGWLYLYTSPHLLYIFI